MPTADARADDQAAAIRFTLSTVEASRRLLSRGKRIAFAVAYTAILLFATAAAIAAVEGWASGRAHLPGTAMMKDVRLNHEWPPHSEEMHSEWIAANPEFPRPYVHKHDAQSWIEDYDVSLAKPAGTYRIFYVGDSFTEGCVPMEESYPAASKPPSTPRAGTAAGASRSSIPAPGATRPSSNTSSAVCQRPEPEKRRRNVEPSIG